MNGSIDLFRRDTLTGEVVQVNVGNYDELGINANRGGSDNRSDIRSYDISDDGRYAMFKTVASQCPGGDGGGARRT